MASLAYLPAELSTVSGLRAGPSRYLVGLGALAATFLFRYLFRETLGIKVPYLQFYPEIIIAAWYGGLGPGLLTTAISTAAAMYFFLPPSGLWVNDPSEVLSLAMFIATGLVISFLNERLHRSQEAERAAAAAATIRAERLDRS